MSFEDLNQFHSFYFAEVINFKREQSGIVIVVKLRDSGETKRERERETDRRKYRQTNRQTNKKTDSDRQTNERYTD